MKINVIEFNWMMIGFHYKNINILIDYLQIDGKQLIRKLDQKTNIMFINF